MASTALWTDEYAVITITGRPGCAVRRFSEELEPVAVGEAQREQHEVELLCLATRGRLVGTRRLESIPKPWAPSDVLSHVRNDGSGSTIRIRVALTQHGGILSSPPKIPQFGGASGLAFEPVTTFRKSQFGLM